MVKTLGFLFTTLLLALSAPVFSQTVTQGNPDFPGRLEFIYSDDKSVAQVDGEYLTEITDGKVVREYDQGQHSVQIFARKGFDLALKQDTSIDIPGGFVVRATIRKEALVVIGYSPIPGQGTPPKPAPAAAAAPGPVTTSTTTTFGLGNDSVQFTTTQTVQGLPPGAGQDAPPAPVPASAGPGRKSQIVFQSEAGQCEVYLDGKKVADMGVAMVDEVAEAKVRDLKPSTYRIKVTSFNKVWYDGKLTVGNGEDLKIQIEPTSFDIVSRDPLP